MPTTTCIVAAIAIILVVNSMADAIKLREYRRPICTPEQTCSYEAFDMVFALCDCPGKDHTCPQNEGNAVEHRGTLYNKRLCSNDEACAIRSFVGEMRFCDCRTGSSCVYPPKEGVSPLSRQTGKCVVNNL
ncbi:hypothetical protein V3C99_017271 [Haemonchus contortus]|uniref:Secreted protein n=1 Tax=Haemonchus contortus TaxID=6289 RepID=A0A7I4Z436_HAECO